MRDDIALVPRSAFAGLMSNIGCEAGVTVCDRDGVGFATIIARKGRAGALAEAVHAGFSLELPTAARRASTSNVAFSGTAPGAWLASRDPDGGFTAELRARLNGLASISDQTSGLATLNLRGPKVRDVLAKGIPIDLHASAFSVGTVAATVCSHIGVTLWRLEDTIDFSSTFELAVYRSLAGSLWRWLAASAAEFGLTVERNSSTESRRA